MEGARYLEDGKLTVFSRAGIYYARIRLTGSAKYITRSLRTSSEQAAVDLGRRLLFQLEQRADQGLSPKSKLFGAVIDDYIRHRERDHRHGGTSAGMLRQIIRVSRFWREYAGELAVEVIDDKVMREFSPTLSRQAMEHRNRRSAAYNDCYNDDCDQAGAGHCSVLHLGRQGPHYQGRRPCVVVPIL